MMKISVIIPIYKVESYLRQCLDSVVNQTYKDLEIILIDDGSPDNCGKICDEYAERDERIIVVHKKNGGLSAARNDGLKLATGQWISFVDSDDYCDLHLYETILPKAEENNADIIIYGFYKQFENDEVEIHPFIKEYVTQDKEFISLLQQSALCGTFTPMSDSKCLMGNPWDKLYRASLIFENSLEFSTNVCANEDIIFNIHTFQFAKKILYIDQILYHYRFNPESIGNKYTPNRTEMDLAVFRELYDIGEKYGLKKEYYKAVDVRIVMNAVMCGNRCFFNPKMRRPFLEKIKMATDFLNSDLVYSAFENVDRNMIPGKLVKIATMMRYPNVWLIYVLTKCEWVKMKVSRILQGGGSIIFRH